ncbi:MAG: DNA internalization-related competence protein ComEC/Rec2, partial [Pseudomonadota bacterium]
SQPHWLVLWLRTQAAVTIALLPLLLALFQQVSLISPFANAIAIPLVSLIVVPLALIGSVLPFDAVLWFAHEVMSGCMRLLDWMSALPNAVWQQHAPVAWTLVAAVFGAFWMLCPRGVPARWLGLFACLPLFLVMPAGPRMGEVRVTVLDVGQGLAVVVRTAQHTLLFDSGPGYGPGVDSGNRIIVPYLRATGVRMLEGLVISHDDADHTGGALSVLQALPVAWLASSLPDMDPLPLISDEAFRCVAGHSWVWDEVRFELLHPTRESVDVRTKNNDRGCVLKVIAAGGSVLIPADIERRSEEALLARGAELPADVIVAGHHGSRTSSTEAFVEAVQPRAVVFAVGYRNRFGHPHPEVLERYRAHGSAAYRTDTDGAVMITIEPKSGVSIARYRAQHRRYWLAAPAADTLVRDMYLDRLQ